MVKLDSGVRDMIGVTFDVQSDNGLPLSMHVRDDVIDSIARHAMALGRGKAQWSAEMRPGEIRLVRPHGDVVSAQAGETHEFACRVWEMYQSRMLAGLGKTPGKVTVH